MTLKKTLLASAVAGLLFSANAGAVVLGTDAAVTYASELEDGTVLAAGAHDTADFAIGYNFSPGEVRYGRFECSSNLTMDNVVVSEASADMALGAINGEGTSALFFSMTASNPIGDAAGTADDVISVDGDLTLEDGGAVTCSFSIYDQPSQAQAGGTTGRIYTTGFDPYINRAPSFVFTATPGEAVADVEAANGAYTAFETTGEFGSLTFGLVSANIPLDADGLPITMADIFDANTSVTITGDYTAAADLTWNGGSADDITGDDATFDVGATATSGALVFVEDGTTPIAESGYTATLNAVANTGYVVADVGPIDAGAIVRNGTQLQAPLAQVPNGWLSRMVLTNTGTLDRPYEISVMGENGNTIGTSNLTGTVPANGTTVVDLRTVLNSFSGQARATLNVTVAGPNNQIQGMYQIVNPASGSISNETMIRPGTN